MNSINNNQPEDNKANLRYTEALKKVKTLVGNTPTCFFCTETAGSGSEGVRPMTIQEVDDQGHLYILIANDSHTYKELQQNAKVHLYFQGSEYSDFLHLQAMASIVNDSQKIKALWKPLLNVWFTQGEQDPRIALLKVEPQSGYYWDNKHGNFVAGIKMLFGAAIGTTFDDSIEGEISL